ESPRQGVMKAAGSVVGKAKLHPISTLSDPWRMLEDAAEAFDKFGFAHPAWAYGGSLIGMMFHPMPGDVDTARQPDSLVALHIVDEALQRSRAAGPADEAAVKADAHHGRASLPAFFIERVESVFQIGEELITRVKALRRGETHIVGIERIGDDDLRFCRIAMAVMVDPVGQIIVI